MHVIASTSRRSYPTSRRETLPLVDECRLLRQRRRERRSCLSRVRFYIALGDERRWSLRLGVLIGDDDLWGTSGRLESSTAGELYTSARYDIALKSRSDTVCLPFVNSAAHGRRSDSPLRRRSRPSPRLALSHHTPHPSPLQSSSFATEHEYHLHHLPDNIPPSPSSSPALPIALWAGHTILLRLASG